MIGDHEAIRHSYENVLTACARLASFASGAPTASRDGLINARQTVLAADDLIVFAINARRLLDNTGFLKQAARIVFQVHRDGKASQAAITRILNVVIHHRTLRVIRYNYEIEAVKEGGEFDYTLFLHENIKYFTPIVMVESDQGGRFILQLSATIERFETEVLSPIVDICAENRLFLEDLIE